MNTSIIPPLPDRDKLITDCFETILFQMDYSMQQSEKLVSYLMQAFEQADRKIREEY